PRFLNVYNAFLKGDMATALKEQMPITEIINTLATQFPVIPATKALLEKQGFAVGDCCVPFHKMTAAEKENLYAVMTKAGLAL
ncbi:MAG: hypothetical protein MJ078_07390, partial [Clostridia bacterium]|nr:hypothetical protein [Clostridia bacterium]